MATIYFDSRTGNVSRFVQKVIDKMKNVEAIKITSGMSIDKIGHLVTYTDRDGEIPDLTRQFLELNSHLVLSVSSSGNINWGRTYGMAADRIYAAYGLPLVIKFELSGLESDVDTFINYVTKSEHIL